MTQFLTVVCIPTYKRVQMLANLLERMEQQFLDVPLGHHMRICVIDNDSKQSAKPEVLAFQSAHPSLDITYIAEPRGGVGYARNTGFTTARPNEWLIFFDDDQTPGPAWAQSLLSLREENNSDVVFGPVTPKFESPLPDWGAGGWAWGAARSTLVDGRAYATAGFGNVMFSSAVLMSGLCKVPVAFLNQPGEDTAVSLALSQGGFKVVYFSAPAAVELVPRSRLSIEWVLARASSNGATWRNLQALGLVSHVRLILFAGKATVEAICKFTLSLTSVRHRKVLRMKARYAITFARSVMWPRISR